MRRNQPASSPKIDEQLRELLVANVLADTSTVPVVVRASADKLEAISALIEQLGGRERVFLSRIGAVAAWVPLKAVATLAALDEVTMVCMAQEFSVA